MKRLARRRAHDDQSMIGQEYGCAIAEQQGSRLAEFSTPRWIVGREWNVAADFELEFFDDAGNRLMIDREHRGMNRMGMNDRGDLRV